ncbi:MAG: amino acid ABC transporter permease [Candidatus Competibacteraceae bacterium]|nr:amino acid ABC transporter permease [Candidatus Competibacteraceae bacterium]
MSDTHEEAEIRRLTPREDPKTAELITQPRARPPATRVGALGWMREHLFSGPFNSLLTVLIGALLLYTIPALFQWALLNAHWATDAQTCRTGDGACWSFVVEKFRFMIFGLYPPELHWRPALAVVIFLSMVAISTQSRFWNRKLLWGWVAVFILCYMLMAGGVLGLEEVPNTLWGGLPLTLMLSVVGVGIALPLGILLALGRRSELPAIRALCVGYIELIRGVPLISLLFMASVMFPLFLPEGVTIDKLLRAQVAIIMFAAAYMAEVVRGGLQAIPKGQYEAAAALGLNYWQMTRLIILPQALNITIPPMVNTFIGLFKDTSLVLIIGLFDLLTTTKAALTDPQWLGFSLEAYLFAALIYFIFTFFMSQYSQHLEARLAAEKEH